MTDFDRSVLRWLDGASISDRARSVTLGRTLVGIQSYAELIRGDDSTGAIPVDAIRLDVGLKDIVARAQRRVDDGQTLNLGELPVPPPAPATLLTSRSAAGGAANQRRSLPRDVAVPAAAPPLSARSGALADPRSARGEPSRPQQVPPLRLAAKKP